MFQMPECSQVSYSTVLPFEANMDWSKQLINIPLSRHGQIKHTQLPTPLVANMDWSKQLINIPLSKHGQIKHTQLPTPLVANMDWPDLSEKRSSSTDLAVFERGASPWSSLSSSPTVSLSISSDSPDSFLPSSPLSSDCLLSFPAAFILSPVTSVVFLPGPTLSSSESPVDRDMAGQTGWSPNTDH